MHRLPFLKLNSLQGWKKNGPANYSCFSLFLFSSIWSHSLRSICLDRMEDIPQTGWKVWRSWRWLEPYHPLSLFSSSRLGRGSNLIHQTWELKLVHDSCIAKQNERFKHELKFAHALPSVWKLPQVYLSVCFTMQQVPVSIADLGGTEIDLRFGSSKEGRLSVIVAPVLRFADSEFWYNLVSLFFLQLGKCPWMHVPKSVSRYWFLNSACYDQILMEMPQLKKLDVQRQWSMHSDRKLLGRMLKGRLWA